MTQFLRDYLPALKYGAKISSFELLSGLDDFSSVWYVDGDNGSNSNVGDTPASAFANIQNAVNSASADDTIFVRNRNMAAGATDPASYAETITVAAGKSRLKILGFNEGRTQGGLPQIKMNSGSTALLTIRSPGVLLGGLGFNGINATGGGILLDDDGSTKTAFGTAIVDSHFKNCAGSSATNAATGGAVQFKGSPWQILVKNNTFFNNVGDVVLTSVAYNDPKDVVVEGNNFSGPAASVDCNVYLVGTLNNGGIVIRDNVFPCFPALSLGANLMPIKILGLLGVMAHNFFGTTGKTFGAAANVVVGTGIIMAANWQESGLIART